MVSTSFWQLSLVLSPSPSFSPRLFLPAVESSCSRAARGTWATVREARRPQRWGVQEGRGTGPSGGGERARCAARQR